MSVNVEQIVVSNKFKHSDKGFKYFIGYWEDDIVKPLCIILPQMSGCNENGGKNMYFWLKMMKCGKNTMKFGMWYKIN